MKLNQSRNTLNFNATLNELIIQYTSFQLKHDYFILMPVYLSVDGTISDKSKKINVELKETSINFCPAILNAIFGMLNSVGTIIEVNFYSLNFNVQPNIFFYYFRISGLQYKLKKKKS